MREKGTVTMSLQEINRCGILKQIEDGILKQAEAAKVMGVSERQTRRLVKTYRERGPDGIVNGLRGKPGNHSLALELREQAIALVKTQYHDFGPTLASEKLGSLHGIRINHETLRLLMVSAGIWKPKKRKVNRHVRRERRSCYGEMEQFDGCMHDWFEGRGPKCTLLASRDDAANEVTARFYAYEGTETVMLFWWGYMNRHGKPQSIYLDRHSTYRVNHKNAADDDRMTTQFERAMDELGIEVIHAHSPQAKGRIENLFGTLQDRLVKELRLAGISTPEEANTFLEETFLPAFNKRFMVHPASSANVHWPVSSKEDLGQILSVQSERYIGNDFTVRFKGAWLQLHETQPTLVLPRARVLVEERLDGSLHVRLNGKYLTFTILKDKPVQRPKTIALTSNPKPNETRKSNKPSPSHPWRNMPVNRQKQDISILQETGHF